jgi:hypothetical protein
VSRSKKTGKASPPEPDIPFEGLWGKPLPPSPGVKHSLELKRKIVGPIRDHCASERNKNAVNEIEMFRRLFNDDELLAKREASIIARDCFRYATSIKATKRFKLGPHDYREVCGMIELEMEHAEHWYVHALAERFIAKVREETKDSLDKFKQSLLTARVPQKKIPMLDQYISDLIPARAFYYFDQHCWPELPAGEKILLKNHFQPVPGRLIEQMLRTIELILKSRSKAHAFACIEFLREIIRTPDKLAEAVEKEGLGKHLQNLVADHMRTRRTNEQIAEDAKMERHRRFKKLYPKFLAKYKYKSIAVHQLLIFLREPAYSLNIKAKGNVSIRKPYLRIVRENF